LPKSWRHCRTRWATRRALASISTRSTSEFGQRENGQPMLVLMWSDLISIALGTGKEDGENFAQMQDKAKLTSSWSGTVHSIKESIGLV
jgi:hypothetical protein